MDRDSTFESVFRISWVPGAGIAVEMERFLVLTRETAIGAV